ncbi:MAG: RDD family protein [Bacteroidia bacterium]|nr:RDD family protein [Bacteroidia bacterium]
MQTISVRTTQNVFIDYPIASLGDRILAYLIDSLIQFAYIALIFYALYKLDLDSVALNVAIITLPFLGYHAVFEILMGGQSPGKRQMKIKVVRMDGTSPTIGNFLMRWLFRLVEIFLLRGAIAIITIAANGRGQRLGDVVAGTTVVKVVPQSASDTVFTIHDENYQPVFAEVMKLTDYDVELLQQALVANRDHGNNRPVDYASEQVKRYLGIESDMPPVKLLYTLIKDYSFYTSQH